MAGWVYRLVHAIDGYNATVGSPVEERVGLWHPVQEALEHCTGTQVRADGFISSLTIYQAGSFALDIRETAQGPDFTPILMSRSKGASLEDEAPSAETGDDEPVASLHDALADALLPPELQQKFVLERYEAGSRTRDAYVFGATSMWSWIRI